MKITTAHNRFNNIIKRWELQYCVHRVHHGRQLNAEQKPDENQAKQQQTIIISENK